MCIPTERSTSTLVTSESGEEALSNSSLHSDNVKSCPFVRMEVCENQYTESCVSVIALLCL